MEWIRISYLNIQVDEGTSTRLECQKKAVCRHPIFYHTVIDTEGVGSASAIADSHGLCHRQASQLGLKLYCSDFQLM